MQHPIIGITLDLENKKTYSAYPWYAARENYSSPISRFGGVPIFLPHEIKYIKNYDKVFDGLVVTGGDFDVDPKFYGEKLNSSKVSLKEHRTLFEYNLIELCLKNNKPILAICGGEQLLNVVLGGSLYQDINDELSTNIAHEQKNPRNEGSHFIEIKENTKLLSIVKSHKMFVNSAHHQSVKTLGKDLIINAECEDGVIEGIEHKSHKFCQGVQWHPEFLISSGDENIFSALVNASRVKE